MGEQTVGPHLFDKIFESTTTGAQNIGVLKFRLKSKWRRGAGAGGVKRRTYLGCAGVHLLRNVCHGPWVCHHKCEMTSSASVAIETESALLGPVTSLVRFTRALKAKAVDLFLLRLHPPPNSNITNVHTPLLLPPHTPSTPPAKNAHYPLNVVTAKFFYCFFHTALERFVLSFFFSWASANFTRSWPNFGQLNFHVRFSGANTWGT